MAKRLGVVGVTKLENAQLGILLKWANDEYDLLAEDGVMLYPEAFKKLCGRYST